MTYARAKKVDADVIPVIDIAPLRDGTDPNGVARALHAANQGLGFIYIVGHGISDQVVEAARDSAYAFFRSPDTKKQIVKVSPAHRGWLGRGEAKMQDAAPADLKESFIWGYQDENGETPEDHPLRGANLWPDFLPDLQGHAMAYFHHAHQVAHHLMRGFALGLGLEEGFFLRSCAQPLSRASFVYYPAQPEDQGEEKFGAGPHTDFGVLTVLCQDSVGGLQIEDINGEWIQAPPIEGSLIVNVAEPTSLGILKPPGERHADITVGEGQGFGLPVSYGGPTVGFFATREEYFRQVPGRIVGETLDREGRRSYALTLATREQHIRREKATSNICTNQGLCALAVTVYLAAMGKQGLRELAIQNLKTADTLKNKLSKLDGYEIKFSGETYNEFVLECPRPAKEVRDRLLEDKIVVGLPLGDHYPGMDNALLICATELTPQHQIDHLVDRLGVL